ncbi:hypothetical protein [Photorhabdus luminescens]|uniref:Uncharacterized protein n=1 Tax=Photorhabdus luminescens subsp. sonorensis TaxID=1173677 RepID=A0A5C4RBM0_PHOLU|nr:hypothetical protein [Photorhabdus luminescens]TNH41370.1 hypothetical protein EP164_23190 [Photorhabdus luminescens subsp. sonorensis]
MNCTPKVGIFLLAASCSERRRGAACRKRGSPDKGTAGKTGLRRRKARQGVLGSAVSKDWGNLVITD